MPSAAAILSSTFLSRDFGLRYLLIPRARMQRQGRFIGITLICLCLLCIIESVFFTFPFSSCRTVTIETRSISSGSDGSISRSTSSSSSYSSSANFAFLMYGQARTLNRTHCSIIRNIVGPVLKEKHRIHFFIHAEDDEDAWQYKSFLRKISKIAPGSIGSLDNDAGAGADESDDNNEDGEKAGKIGTSKGGGTIQYTIKIEKAPKASKACVEIFSKKYEKRVDRIVSGPKGSYPSELLAQLMHREATSELMYAEKSHFDVVVLLRPDVEYANKIPIQFYLRSNSFFMSITTSQMNTIQVPAFAPYGGFNDRFMISSFGNAAKHYLSIYSGLCGEKSASDIITYRKNGLVNELPDRRKGLNAERIYAWWMKKGDYSVSTALLANFVFYRVRRNVSMEEGPDGNLGRRFWLWNPSLSKWSDTVKRHFACAPLHHFGESENGNKDGTKP